jgi:hypothetical protein
MTRSTTRWRVFFALAALAAFVSTSAAFGEEASDVRQPARRRPSAAKSGSIVHDFDCDLCHSPEGWNVGPSHYRGKRAGFDHGAATGFELEGHHLSIPCMACHGQGRNPIPECANCHEDGHAGRLGRDCQRCHRPTDWRDVRAEEIHATTQFPLTGAHLRADCTECHRRVGERQWSSVPTDCYACHADDYRRTDVHPRHSGGAAPFPTDCEQCHRPTAWSPAVVDPAALPGRAALTSAESHDLRFPLSYGPHRGASCDDCHVDPSARRAVRCTGCHEHNAVRLRVIHGARIGSPETTRCLACHPGGIAR